MILVCGGIKGGSGKSTLATNLAVMRSLAGKDVLLVDADEQGTATDFTAVRNETLPDGAGYTTVKLHGAPVRSEVLRMAPKFDDVVIDAGGRDTAGQRAAISIASILLVPFRPRSFDLWPLEDVGKLVQEALAFNENLKAYSVLNCADPKGQDNVAALEIARQNQSLTCLDIQLGNRKVFGNAAANGMAVTEYKPTDKQAVKEMTALYKYLFDA